tara:strand:+ start:1172 stop:2905 length:1734 start_codon:yes stop_codon:yes gene_type:complete
MNGNNYTYMWKKPGLPLNGATWKWSPNGVKNLYFSNRYPVPLWSAPITKTSHLHDNRVAPIGASFRARPIRHWRKQVQPRLKKMTGRTGIGMYSEKPGSQAASFSANNKLFSDFNCKDVSSYFLTDYVLRDTIRENSAPMGKSATPQNFLNRDKFNPQVIDYSNPKRVCTACNAEANVIKSGMANINSQDYSYDTAGYLSNRCKTYEKNSVGVKDPETITTNPVSGKMTWPSNSDYGPQVRIANNCNRRTNDSIKEYNENQPGFRCSHKIIYKPNNVKFAQQGGVSSSSRIQRLRHDRLTNDGARFKNAIAAKAVNYGLYPYDGLPQYFIKTKYMPHKCHSKDGNHSKCFYTPTGSVGGKAPIIPKPPHITPKKEKRQKMYSCYPQDSENAGKCKQDTFGIYTIDQCSKCSVNVRSCATCPPEAPCFNTVTKTCSAAMDEQGNCAGQLAGVINCNNEGKTPCEICNDPNFPCFNETNSRCEALNSLGKCDGEGNGVKNCNNEGKSTCEICTDGCAYINEISNQVYNCTSYISGTNECLGETGSLYTGTILHNCATDTCYKYSEESGTVEEVPCPNLI